MQIDRHGSGCTRDCVTLRLPPFTYTELPINSMTHNNSSYIFLFRRAELIVSTTSITFLNVFDKNQVQFFFKLHGSPRQNVV